VKAKREHRDAAAGAAEGTYAFRPSLMSSEHRFALAPDALEFHIGRHSGRVPYATIRRLRVSFRPLALASNRYLTEIWADGWPKLQVASTSWRSIFEQASHAPAYSDFVRELHRRVAAAGGAPRCRRGSPAWLFWPGAALFAAVALGLAALIVRGLREGTLVGAVFVAAFLALFLWHMGGFLRKNRPVAYSVEAPPQDVLPTS
jgi:hypothetical protein